MAQLIECGPYGCSTYIAEVRSVTYEDGGDAIIEVYLDIDGDGAVGPFGVEFYSQGELVGSIEEVSWASATEYVRLSIGEVSTIEGRLYIPWADKETTWTINLPERIEPATIEIIGTDDATDGRGPNEAKVDYRITNPNNSDVDVTIRRSIDGDNVGPKQHSIPGGGSDEFSTTFLFDYQTGEGQVDSEVCIEHFATEIQ